MKNIYLSITFCLAFVFTLSAQGDYVYATSNSFDKIAAIQKEISALDDEHCEVPCGIYGDSLRVSLLKEHSSTVEKAMNQINKLSAEAKPNYNQIVRWVMNKESHAKEIQHIVSQYFLHQRVKMPKAGANKKDVKKYNTQLSTLHSVLVYAMKCKQTTDVGNISKMNTAIHDFEHAYFGAHKGHKH